MKEEVRIQRMRTMYDNYLRAGGKLSPSIASFYQTHNLPLPVDKPGDKLEGVKEVNDIEIVRKRLKNVGLI